MFVTFNVELNQCFDLFFQWNVRSFRPLSSANKCLLKVGAYCAQLEQYQKAIEIYEQVRWEAPSEAGSGEGAERLSVLPPAGGSQHDGQPPAEIQCQGVLLQSLPLPLHRWRAQRQGECCQQRGEGRGNSWRKFQHAVVSLQIAVEKYEEMFPAFSDSRECKLLKVTNNFIFFLSFFAVMITNFSLPFGDLHSSCPLQKLLEAHEEQNSEAFTEAVSPVRPPVQVLKRGLRETLGFEKTRIPCVCWTKRKANCHISPQSPRNACSCGAGWQNRGASISGSLV